jgi:hypothetical protein
MGTLKVPRGLNFLGQTVWGCQATSADAFDSLEKWTDDGDLAEAYGRFVT